jgi:uncharacterized protein
MTQLRIATITGLLLTAFICSASAEENRTISSSGSAAVHVAPDQVIVTLGIETSSTEIQAARQENDQKVRAVMAAAEALGIERAHIQTAYMNIEPRWESAPHRFMGYWCTKTVVVQLNDISKYEQLVANLLSAGANYLHGIEFRSTELRKHRDKARQMAIKAAREKAVALAGELSLGVGTARSISEGSSNYFMSSSHWGSRSSGYMNATQNQAQVVSSSGNADNSDSPLAPGRISISADVSVTFDLETTATVTRL